MNFIYRLDPFSCVCWLGFCCPAIIVLRNGLVTIWLFVVELLLLVDDVRVDNGGELDASEEASRFDDEFPVKLVGFDGNEPNIGNGKFWWWAAAAAAAANILLSDESRWENACIIGDGAGGGGGGSFLGVDERLWLVGVFDDVGRTTTGTTGVDEVVVVVVGIVDVAVFNGDVEWRCASKRFNVSLVAVVTVVVVTVVDDVKQGVFITSRNIFGIDVDFVVAVDADDDEFVSTIDVVGSVTIAVEVVDVPFATSSITSSICDRDAVVVVVVTGCFSPARFDDETIFDTIVIKSFCCVGGVETLAVVTAVVVCRDCWSVGLGNDVTNV